MVTWEELVNLEPRLLDLETKCRQLREGRDLADRMWLWFGGNAIRGRIPGKSLKTRMSELVGWHAITPPSRSLCNSGAFQVAYKHLTSVLDI